MLKQIKGRSDWYSGSHLWRTYSGFYISRGKKNYMKKWSERIRF